MPGEIAELSGDILSDPIRVEVTPQATPIERVEQSVHHVAQADKLGLLADILGDPSMTRVIVFARTKHRANRVAERLERSGIASDAIHGNKSQGARQRALKRFKDGSVRVLVATDIAARGIDVDSVSHVINFELPNEPESYVHRIGRTARAGNGGAAISFCDPSERVFLRDIERLIKSRLTVIGEEPAMPAARGRAGTHLAQKPRGGRYSGKPSHGKPSGGKPAFANASEGKPWHKHGRPKSKLGGKGGGRNAARRRRRAA